MGKSTSRKSQIMYDVNVNKRYDENKRIEFMNYDGDGSS